MKHSTNNVKLINYLGLDWYEALKPLIESEYFQKLGKYLRKERQNYMVYPKQNKDIFTAFKITPLNNVRGVILGQDPYHNGKYDGLCFSNATSITPAPSLRNILKEVNNDIYAGKNIERLSDLSLYSWAEQGLLMINTALTVREHQPDTHTKVWKRFTLEVINILNKQDNIIWMMWGRHASSFRDYITNKSHGFIETSHPSPLGATKGSNPFIGSQCFSKFNIELSARNKREIIW